MHIRSRPDPRDVRDQSFRLRPASAGGFDAVELALTRKLVRLATRPERLAVVVNLLDDRDANRFTQTLVDRVDGAWVEAASNKFITGDGNLLGPQQQRLLAIIGFDPPAPRYPNHFVLLDQPVDWARVAAMLIRPLEPVYGADPGEEIELKVYEVGRPSPEDPADDIGDDESGLDEGDHDDGGFGGQPSEREPTGDVVAPSAPAEER